MSDYSWFGNDAPAGEVMVLPSQIKGYAEKEGD